jgi:hypothetical protein
MPRGKQAKMERVKNRAIMSNRPNRGMSNLTHVDAQRRNISRSVIYKGEEYIVYTSLAELYKITGIYKVETIKCAAAVRYGGRDSIDDFMIKPNTKLGESVVKMYNIMKLKPDLYKRIRNLK